MAEAMADEEEVMETEASEKRFGSREIFWIIDNYFAATCRENWVVQSPEFCVRGFEVTRWRIFLKPKYLEENYIVQAYLERLESDPYPGEVQVKWMMSYVCGDDDYTYSSNNETKASFGKSTAMKSSVCETELLEKKMMSSSNYSFALRCKIIVYLEDYQICDAPEHSGYKDLSQNMKRMLRTGKGADVYLYISGELIFGHKAILSARNRVLKTYIHRHGENLEFDDLEGLQKGVASNLIAFFYSADLDYILRTPSFSMQRLIEFFKVSELQSYYSGDRLVIRNNYDAMIYNFTWLIPDIGSTDGFITSPAWKIECLNLTVQMRLYPKGFGDETNYMSLIGEFTKGEEPEALYFACGIQSKDSHINKWKYKAWSPGEDRILGFQKFISRDILEGDSWMIWGNFQIVCRFIIPTGNQDKCVVSDEICSLVDMGKNKHYERLSADFEYLFESAEHSDLGIETRMIRFRAHKIILSTSSHVFANKIKDIRGEQKLAIREYPSNILFGVIRYIYTGTLNKYPIKDSILIYSAAENYSILPLMYTCSKILQENFDIENALDILVVSDNGKDSKLKQATLKFISSNLEQIHARLEWEGFKAANKGLHDELIQYAKTYLQNRGEVLPLPIFNIDI